MLDPNREQCVITSIQRTKGRRESTMIDKELQRRWWFGRMSDQELADAVMEPKRSVQMVLAVPEIQSSLIGGGRGQWRTRVVPSWVRVAVPLVFALHHNCGFPLEKAGSIVGRCRRICEQIAAVVDFIPPNLAPVDDNQFDPAMLLTPDGSEFHPLGWYEANAAFAMETIYPGIDECLEFLDRHSLFWSSPVRIPLSLLQQPGTESICSIPHYRREEAERHYQKIYSRYRNDEWVCDDFLSDTREKASRENQGMFQNWDSRLTTEWKFKTSINVSVCARSMKRRALGLQVIEFGDDQT